MTTECYMRDLKEIRAAIDAIDDEVIQLLAKRYSFLNEVVAYKKLHNLPAVISVRVEEVKQRNVAHGTQLGLSPAFIERLYTLIIDEYCRLEAERL